jgi:hypothetical protein
MIRGWVLDELAHAGRENLNTEHVARYDRKMDASAAAEVELLRDLGMEPPSCWTWEWGLGSSRSLRQLTAGRLSPSTSLP